MDRTKLAEIWECKGRNGSGCGWRYESPIGINGVTHKCEDGSQRALTFVSKKVVENKGAGRKFF